MSKKYQVFISSTYSDLKEEREQVIKAVLEMGHIPVGMEMFSAADEEQWKLIARQIDEIDFYVLIVAHRYGSVTNEGISYTEKEFEYALAKGVPVLGFVIDDAAPWPKDRHEEDSKGQKKLTEFKKKIKGRLIHFWKNKEELHGKVSISLMKSITTNLRTGWVRANEVAGPEVTKELTRLSSENAVLREEVDRLRRLGEEQHDEVRKVIRVLSSNSRSFKVRKTGEWKDAKTYTCTLADIFHFTAANLINENTTVGVAQNIALEFVGTGYYGNFPLGSNIVADMIADMAALDLMEPSKKKHSVHDKHDYWSLTKLGKQVLKEFRKVRLEEGLAPTSDLAPEST